MFRLSITDLLQKAPRSPSPQSIPIMEDFSPSRTEGIAMYNLRTAVRNLKKPYLTWLDQDESGDYDPQADDDAIRFENDSEPAAFEASYRKDCMACTRGRMVCSYRADGDRRRPCNDCVRLHRRCEVPKPRPRRRARPPPQPSPERSTHSQSPPPTPRTRRGSRPPPSPSPSRSTRSEFPPTPRTVEPKRRTRRCARPPPSPSPEHSNRSESPPPTPRTKRGAQPPPSPLPSRSTRTKSPPPPRTVERASTPEEHQRPQTFILSTRLAHPIQFNFQPRPDDDQIACHWCDSLIYGILGLGLVHASVVDGGDGQGYIERANGHTAAGHLPARMCVPCTTRRIRILACPAHEMHELPNMKRAVVAPETQARSLLRDDDDDASFDWCSVCPHVAYYACGNGDDDDGRGCGLRLCAACTLALVGQHDGDLARFLESRLVCDESDVGFGLRADAGLLHPDGELMRRVRHDCRGALA